MEQVAAFSAKAKTRVDLTIRESIIGITAELVERSPVGDPSLWASKPAKTYEPGTFRANWQGGFGAINLLTTDDKDVTGEISIVSVTSQIPDDPKGVFYVTNSLPYAIPLEDGHSRQAPLGIVGLTVLDWKNIVNDAVLRVIR